MSVMVVNESSLKTITVFLIKSLGFEENPGNYIKFSVFLPEKEYPKLYELLKRCNKEFQTVTKFLSVWNCKAYANRYPDQDFDLEAEAELIERFNDHWYRVYANIKPIQIHKTLSCYLYQVETESSILKELKNILREYGNWLLGHTGSWSEAKWE